jgi:Putative Ig domain
MSFAEVSYHQFMEINFHNSQSHVRIPDLSPMAKLPQSGKAYSKAGRFLNMRCRWLAVLAVLCGLLPPLRVEASGTWTALVNHPPGGVNNSLLMSDGTVICGDGGQNWYRLTPDAHGSYANGTWTQIASTTYSRLFFSSDVLTNGNVYVAGGEYGSGHSYAELYDSLANTWSVILQPPGVGYSDAPSKLLSNGNVLQSDSQSSIYIYNASSNIITADGGAGDQNEACWVRLPNDNVLTIDAYGQNSEHYVSSLNHWYADGNVPVAVYGFGGELGPALVLPNGNVFQIGATTNTAIYTPGPGLTSAGTWIAGPPMVFGTNQLGAVDAPAAMMVNGKILCALGGIGGFDGPIYFYEYDYVANSFTQVNGPHGITENNSPFATSMLDLPDGSVLFIDGQGTTSLYVYKPDGTPLAAGQPTISTITENADGSYHLTGVGLNGITGGAAYGDDWQMDTSYPLVRMTNNTSGNVYYARTYQWSSTTIQNANPVTTEFSLPQNLPSGTYSLVVAANGNPSAPTTFTYSPPPVPTGLTAASGSNAFVNLQWNTSSGAMAYNVKRATHSGGYFTIIATVSGTTYTNSGLTNGLTSYYKVSAIGSGGPSSDSAQVSATPAGPVLIPDATPVSLVAYYNRSGIFSDGRTFTTGLDGGSSAYSDNLLGPSLLWNNLIFNFGPPNVSDVVYCASQVINLPAGRFSTLQIMAAGVNGNQTAQTFTVTYTDNSTAAFTQSFSDWANSQSYPGEFTVIKMPYRNLSSGGSQTLNVTVDAYVFTLDQTKTVKNITLPNNSKVVLLSMMLASDPAGATLTAYYNRAGIYTDGTAFTNPATGGIDGGGAAYSGTLLGTSQTWSNTLFAFGPLNATNVISSASQTITLPRGNYSRLQMLATGVQGNQVSQSFIVTYTDSSTTTFVQSLSDWFSPQSYAGESKAFPMSHRNSSNGTTDNRTFYLYGYSFPLNNAKIVQNIQLPNSANVIVTAISLVPNWPPTFNVNPFALTNANAGQAYSGTIASSASDLNGDAITYAKVNGPAWLTVTANGTLSGVPASSDANTNLFVVSVTDTGGLSNTATLYIYVNGAPSFAVNPFTLPAIIAGQSYFGTIATNATDPNPGDVLTYAKVSGPTWLSVAANGTISGVPANSDVNTNVFIVSVTDSGGLSNTATLFIYVNGAPTFTVNPFVMPAIVAGQNYSGTIATNATDPNPGDALTFAKISGPAWLTIAINGDLSGTPFSSDVGVNNFMVSVTDPGNLSNTAAMNITVTAAPPIVSTLSIEADGLLLNWFGGIAPYQVQATTDLVNSNWQNIAGIISSNSLPITPSNSVMFYRIIGQ